MTFWEMEQQGALEKLAAKEYTMEEDTIAALATAPVTAAVGIIRISGPEAVAVAGKVFRTRSGLLADAPDRMMVIGRTDMDAGLAVVMRGPRSYTGEDVVELHLHGGTASLAQVLRQVYEAGARPAQAGEFTRRALLNGKLTLTRAEAVADIISAPTSDAAANAAAQLEGALDKRLHPIWDDLTGLLAHFQAEVDFPEEDIDPLTLPGCLQTLEDCQRRLSGLAATFERGKRLRQGALCVLAGSPNTGKSSVLNRLLGYDRAIVTDIPGTTRDTLEECVTLGGVLLRVNDTAGLRDSDDRIEQMGVQRTKDLLDRAELTLLVLDGSAPWEEPSLPGMSKTIVLVNKSDLPHAFALPKLEAPVLRVSALTGDGFDDLARQVQALLGAGPPDGGLITNARQADAVARAAQAVQLAMDGLRGGITPDAVLGELEQSLDALGEVTGRRVTQDMIHQIFSRFCVGK